MNVKVTALDPPPATPQRNPKATLPSAVPLVLADLHLMRNAALHRQSRCYSVVKGEGGVVVEGGRWRSV